MSMRSTLNMLNAKMTADTRANGATTSRPAISYGAHDHYSAKMDKLAQVFAEAGLNTEAEKIRTTKSRLDNGIPGFLRAIGSETSIKAKQTERAMVGHSRSGYVPTGNLMRSIGMTIDGPTKVTVKPDTDYDAYVEYGTRKHPVPEPYMQDTYKDMSLVINAQLAKFANSVI